MRDILAVQPESVQCAGWCSGGHVPSDDGSVTHVSVEQVLVTDQGGETHEFYVSVERVDTADEFAPADIRLEGPPSAPMTPDQALALAGLLTAAAFAAVTGQAVQR